MSNVDQTTMRRSRMGNFHHDPILASNLFTLFAPLTDNGNVYLINKRGSVVHQWKLSMRPGRHAVILSNGNLGYNGAHPDSPNLYPAWELWHGGCFNEVTPSGEIVWEHTDMAHHHDGQWLPNGNIIYTVVERLPRDIAQIVSGKKRKFNNTVDYYGDVIKEVNRSGQVVWLWKSWEHLDITSYPVHEIFNNNHWPLINGLSITSSGNLLISLRTTSGVILVDKKSGACLWEIKSDIVAQQHAPLELNNGNFLIFDNGNFRPSKHIPFSRVLEINPTNLQIIWEYTDTNPSAFFSPYMGSAQRLENGNTFIVEAHSGRLFEVTSQKEIVWEYVIPFFNEYFSNTLREISPGLTNSVFKAYKYNHDSVSWL